LFLLLSGARASTLISLTGPSSVTPGQAFSVDVNIDGAPASPGLAAYIVTVNYDAADLTPTAQLEGNFLTDVSSSVPGEATYFSSVVGDGTSATNLPAGEIQITDITQYGDPTPDSSGVLFGLNFAQTSSASAYMFGFVPNDAADGYGNYEFTDSNFNDIPAADLSFNSLTVNVSRSTATPEPNFLFIDSAFLALLLACRFARRRRNGATAPHFETAARRVARDNITGHR